MTPFSKEPYPGRASDKNSMPQLSRKDPSFKLTLNHMTEHESQKSVKEIDAISEINRSQRKIRISVDISNAVSNKSIKKSPKTVAS